MPSKPRQRSRRLVGVVLAAVAVAGLGPASAAQLGVGASTLAAGAAEVGDCQAGAPIRVELVSAWDTAPATDRFTTTRVRVRGVAPACVGQSLKVIFVNGANASLAEFTIANLPDTPPIGYHELTLASGLETSSIDRAEVVIHS